MTVPADDIDHRGGDGGVVELEASGDAGDLLADLLRWQSGQQQSDVIRRADPSLHSL